MRLIVLLLAGWLSACTAGDVARGVVVRDSGGVRIVENDLEAGDLERYVIGDDPVVEIGAVEGEEPYLLDYVRRARWLEDGSIAVLNAGTAEIRVFDGAGRHLRTYGRRGGGPGEHSYPMEVWQHGDSLVVFDMGRITLTSLADGGARVIGRSALPEERPYQAEAWFGEDGVVVPVQVGRPSEVGTWADISVDYVLVPLDGAPRNTLLRVPSGRLGMVPFRSQAGRQAILTTPPLFGGRARAAVHGGFLFAGPSFHTRIGVYDMTGRHVRDIRWSSPGEPVTPERLADLPETSREEIEAIVPADTFPHFDALLADDEGRLWVRSFDLPGDTALPHWTVFDTAGVAEAVIEMPRDLVLFDVRRDAVLGRRTDSLGVQHVVVLPVQRKN